MVQIITVDGPSGSGKGTVCRLLANKLGYNLLDSGAIYRIAALAAVRKEIALHDTDALINLARNMEIRFSSDGDTATKTELDGQDVSAEIRQEEIGLAASKIAPIAELRVALLERQRSFASEPGLVADGRDMGTVVFPSAQLKVFLTASAEERARRRMLQLEQAGVSGPDFDKILYDIKKRDDRDMNRAAAPLKPADDAVLVDSSDLSIAEVLELILKHVKLASSCTS